jgi:hypothetical protein
MCHASSHSQANVRVRCVHAVCSVYADLEGFIRHFFELFYHCKRVRSLGNIEPHVQVQSITVGLRQVKRL